MKKFFSILLIFCLAFSLIGCSNNSDNNEDDNKTPGLSFNIEDYPRVDGSTVTIPLSEKIFSVLTSTPIDDSPQYILHNTTHNAYVNLINGAADIIFVTEPSEEEYQLAKDAGIELEVVPIVSEAFVFLVNDLNPVKSLTVDEIQGIYSGKIKNWKEVGGEDNDIIAYQRPTNSGSQTGMLSIVMKDIQISDAPTELKPQMMDDLVEVISSYDNSKYAIGYSYYYYVSNMYTKDNMRLLEINDVKPTNFSITNKEYPFTTAYYAVVRNNEPKDSNARKLIEWILSDEGQKVCEEAGYVPIK